MIYYVLKISITVLLIVLISEISKKSTLMGAILASVPLVSVLAMLWLYIDTKDISRISALSFSIFWLVLPSLAFFLTLPILLKQGLSFYLSMTVSIAITITCYWIMVLTLSYFDIKL